MRDLVDNAGNLARRVDAGTAGVVRLGFTAVSAISVLGPLLRRLTAALPDVEVLLSEQVTNAQVDGIRRAELDVGLARPPFDTDFLDSRVVLREPLIAVVPVDHPLAGVSRPLTPSDFEGQPVIGYHPQQSRYFHELQVRFLTNAHPRVEQRVHRCSRRCCWWRRDVASPWLRPPPRRSTSRASCSGSWCTAAATPGWTPTPSAR